MKKSLALMLALIMVLCMIPTTAFAADIIDQKNSVSIYKGEPINYIFLRNFPGGSITKQENEEVIWQRLPRYTNICRSCGSVLVEVIPDYCINPDKNIEITNPEVIGKYGVRVANWKGGQGYSGDPCFEFYCKAAKAGETDVKVTYFYNYNYPGESGYCNRCGNRVTVKAQTSWYKESVTFHVKFVDEDPVGIPDKPTDISGIVDDKAVKVHCTTNNSHFDNTYGLISGSFTIGDVTKDTTSGNYTCTITVQPGEYESTYNKTYSGHTLVNPSQPGNIKLEWDGSKWEVVSGVPVVFNVKCDNTQEPPIDKPKPPKPENTPGIPGLTDIEAAVKVKCETVPAKHIEKQYKFNWSSCQVGDVTDNGADGYTCTITILPDGYVDSYNALYYSGHTLVGPESYTITLNCDAADKQWKYTENKLPVTFTVKCETVPEETYYIVTYTDGVGGTAFVDQAIRVKSGDPTPAFNGTPSRSGYTFTGWTPAVTDTVTGNVTYTAQWKNNDNHTPGGGNGGGHSHYYPTTTPVPVIVIPPKTGDMTIWQSILHFLGIR